MDVGHTNFTDHGELIGTESRAEQLGRRGLDLGDIKPSVSWNADVVTICQNIKRCNSVIL